MIRQWMPWNALIFETWVKSGEPWIRYETCWLMTFKSLKIPC